MKLFIDTANLKEIREANSWGIIDGVTTNPTLIAKENQEFLPLIHEICSIVDGPISVEVLSQKSEEIIKEGKELAKLHRNIVLKIPLTTDGLKATRVLSNEGCNINVTLCFSPAQALLAAKAGATYVSPFIGRLDDISHFGMEIVRDILTIYQNYDFKTKIIVASIRHPLHVVEAALAGAHIATAPFKVLEQLVKHPLTDIGIERFLKDWRSLGDKGKR